MKLESLSIWPIGLAPPDRWIDAKRYREFWEFLSEYNAAIYRMVEKETKNDEQR